MSMPGSIMRSISRLKLFNYDSKMGARDDRRSFGIDNPRSGLICFFDTVPK